MLPVYQATNPTHCLLPTDAAFVSLYCKIRNNQIQLNLLKNPQKERKEGNTSPLLACQLRAAVHLCFAAPASEDIVALCSPLHFDPQG